MHWWWLSHLMARSQLNYTRSISKTSSKCLWKHWSKQSSRPKQLACHRLYPAISMSLSSLLSATLMGRGKWQHQQCLSNQFWSKQKTKTTSRWFCLAVAMKWFNPLVKMEKMILLSRVANPNLWIWIEGSLKCLKRLPPTLCLDTIAIIEDRIKLKQLRKTNPTLLRTVKL